jgi:uncharacterized protein YvpB
MSLQIHPDLKFFIFSTILVSITAASLGCLTSASVISIIAPPTLSVTPVPPSSSSPTIIIPAASATKTPTPFQPLPTGSATPTEIPDTLTPTPTATVPSSTPTLTPTVTRTRKPKPTHTPEPTEPLPLPAEAYVDGLVGHAQLFTLDCEARSAVDLAAFFGVVINEKDFLDKLPRSDDPNAGFVGSYRDPRGQLPPDSYGVYARPVAKLLKHYGIKAQNWTDLSWESIQAEISEGRPVMVWVIGNTWPGIAVEYTASNDNTSLVARFEHTVIVVGYTETSVTLVDGDLVYNRTLDEFEQSWGVLNRMAITVQN